MSENNSIIKLIKQTIDISIDFDGLMDSIDFDSYLSEGQEKEEIVETPRFKEYKGNITKAYKYCNDIINSIEDRIRENNFKPDLLEKDDFTKYLIHQLYKAKNTRISSRQNYIKKNDIQYYSISDKRLNNAFNLIPLKRPDKQGETENLLDNYNWARVLYLNELAICYSGLIKTSMSLGSAEESIKILEDIYPELKTIENISELKVNDSMVIFERSFSIERESISSSQVLKLYSFALVCKGEAEYLLHKIEGALKTFQRIININSKCYKSGKNYLISNSDFYAAILRKSQIYIDQGRSQDALECLKSLDNLDITDRRFKDRDLEKVSARIDQKEYNLAFTLLQYYTSDEWINTFANRKARIYILRLLYEFKDNRPLDFAKEVREKTILGLEYSNYENTANDIIIEAWERRDGDSFKGACDKLADYYKSNSQNLEKALKCYYLYLLDNKIFEYDGVEIIQDWLGDKELVDLLKEYQNNFLPFIEKERNRGIDSILKSFYSTYIKYASDFKDKFKEIYKSQNVLIEELKNSLVNIYYLKDKDIQLEKIEIEHEKFIESLKEPKGIKGDPERFIINAFFKNHINNINSEQSGMHIESIANHMKQNTTDFIKKVVGKSKTQININKSRSTLTVLRRWNSFTPTLSSSLNKSKGGGYFFRLFQDNSSLGIVIDPGYNFLENFFSQGFKIGDIDLILVSHNHPDHTDDLAALLALIHEMNGRLGKYLNKKEEGNKRNPALILSSGVFENYSSIIKSSEKELKDIIVVDQKDDLIPVYEHAGIQIQAFPTAHQDLSQFQSLGFIITVNDNKQEVVIGYTGDIKWRQNNSKPPKYLKYFKNCSIVCVHLGSTINILHGNDFCRTFCENYNNTNPDKGLICDNYLKCKTENFKKVKVTRSKLIAQTREENHLYLAGITLFFNALINIKKPKLKIALFSEFGEELKHGIRIDLYKKLNGWFHKSKSDLVILPGDIGLEIDVFSNEVLCNCCNQFVKGSNIKPVLFGKEEAICFVCKECEEILSIHQIDIKLKEYCENGRQLESVDSNNS